MVTCTMKLIEAALFYLLQIIVISGTPVQEFISGNNLFTSTVYKEILKTNKGNIFVSPFSVEIVLALTQSGAEGETGQEIRSALHLPNTKEDTEAAIKELLPALKGDENYSLYTGNKIYIQSGLIIKQQFKAIATNTFQSDIENINFAQSQQAASTINKWIANHTNNKIQDLISPIDLDASTLAVLVNALYFKADWQTPFDKELTWKQTFYKTNQDTTEVEMMRGHNRFCNYYDDPDLDATYLVLPFKGENISMVIVLPNQKEGISVLEGHIEKVFTGRQFRRGKFNIIIPKFKFAETIKLNEMLSNLGVKKAFTNEADFSGIVGEQRDLFIDTIKQKAFIDVNEAGVEAVAVTFLEAAEGSIPIIPPRSFLADHPFIFYIKHGNTILFAGKIVEPVHQKI